MSDNVQYTYDIIEQAHSWVGSPDIPDYIQANLTPHMILREYQQKAIQHFITYFNNDNEKIRPSDSKIWALFQMATATGKTLVMSALILYLYDNGYRNFVFCVNQSALVDKTRKNMVSPSSPKYLFAKHVVMNERNVKIREVTSFADSNPNDINIMFSTIQGLAAALSSPKENGISYDDFEQEKIVIIADEAHHNKADTKKKNGGDADTVSWESVITNIYDKNDENVMLEFTATSGIATDEEIANQYKHDNGMAQSLVYNYDLRPFRNDGYTKELANLSSSLNADERLTQAMLLSQYRQDLFEDMKIGGTKPLILCRNTKKNTCEEAYEHLISLIKHGYDPALITAVRNNAAGVSLLTQMFNYYDAKYNGYTPGQVDQALAQALCENFPPERITYLHSGNSTDEILSDVNNIESTDVPYRIVFTVDMLNEGWDALNLFDLVLLEDKKLSDKETTTEVQLIGRGARYFPFGHDGRKQDDMRKFDEDLGNPYRICETFLYHCKNDSGYIASLSKKLADEGLQFDDSEDNSVEYQYIFKESFKNSDFYKNGIVYVNEKEEVPREKRIDKDKDTELFVNVNKELANKTTLSLFFDDETNDDNEKQKELTLYKKSFKDFPANIRSKALRMSPALSFQALQKIFPSLRSSDEFMTKKEYAGESIVNIHSTQEPSPAEWCEALIEALAELQKKLKKIKPYYKGTVEFHPVPISECFGEVSRRKKISDSAYRKGGEGVAQSDAPSDIRLDLSDQDWFVYTENYGTPEEKACVRDIAAYVERLQNRYEEVYLIRNEQELKIYDFEAKPEHNEFRPDFILFLRNKNGWEQKQIFIEPKGSGFREHDEWKEDLLKKIGEQARIEDSSNNITILEFPFYNQEDPDAVQEFANQLERLL